jgi:hypothetical protein
MIVEIAIPDREIAYIHQGQQVVVRLNAFPRQTWSSTLDKIHPRSENKDGHNVFIGEVRLDNADQLLRPGMDGGARVIGDWVFRYSVLLGWLGWNERRIPTSEIWVG